MIHSSSFLWLWTWTDNDQWLFLLLGISFFVNNANILSILINMIPTSKYKNLWIWQRKDLEMAVGWIWLMMCVLLCSGCVDVVFCYCRCMTVPPYNTRGKKKTSKPPTQHAIQKKRRFLLGEWLVKESKAKRNRHRTTHTWIFLLITRIEKRSRKKELKIIFVSWRHISLSEYNHTCVYLHEVVKNCREKMKNEFGSVKWFLLISFISLWALTDCARRFSLSIILTCTSCSHRLFAVFSSFLVTQKSHTTEEPKALRSTFILYYVYIFCLFGPPCFPSFLVNVPLYVTCIAS